MRRNSDVVNTILEDVDTVDAQYSTAGICDGPPTDATRSELINITTRTRTSAESAEMIVLFNLFMLFLYFVNYSQSRHSPLVGGRRAKQAMDKFRTEAILPIPCRDR